MNKKLKITIPLLMVSVLSFYCSEQSESSAEITEKDPKHAKVLAESDTGAIVEITLPPGYQQPEHFAKNRIVYSLNDYTLEWTENDEQSTKTWKQGDVHEHGEGKHSAKNTGSDEAKYIVFIKKTKSSGEHSGNDQKPSQWHEKLHESENFIVYKISLPSGEQIPSHKGLQRMVYSLSDYEVEYQHENEKGTYKFKAGESHIHDIAEAHSVKNIGDTTAEFIVVALR